MTHYKFTESEVKETALESFAGLDYDILSGPEIAPGEPATERTDYHQPFLLQRVRDTLYQINNYLTPTPPSPYIPRVLFMRQPYSLA